MVKKAAKNESEPLRKLGRVAEILEALRYGGLHTAGRAEGKSTALLLLAHEFMTHKPVAVVCRDFQIVSYNLTLWRALFGEKEPPRITAVAKSVSGNHLVLTDEITERQRMVLRQGGGVIFAGVESL